MSSSSSIAEALGSPQVVVGLGATTLVLLATTFFYLKNNEGSSGRGESSSGSALDKVEELDTQVRSVSVLLSISFVIQLQFTNFTKFCTQEINAHFFFLAFHGHCILLYIARFSLSRNIPEDTSQSTTALKPAQLKCSPNKSPRNPNLAASTHAW